MFIRSVSVGCALLLGACSSPQGAQCWDSSDARIAEKGSTITVTGSAQRQDGTGLEGQVLLEKTPSLSELFGAVFSLGLSCLQDNGTIDCSEYTKLPLVDGRFTHSLPEADTRGTLGDRTFVLYAGTAGPAGLTGPSVIAHARFRTQPVQLPVLRLWEPVLAPSQAGGQLNLELAAPPALSCTHRTRYELRFTNSRKELVWSQPVGPVDVRVLEEGALRVRATAEVENDASWNAVLALALDSGEAAVTGTAGAPPSRGVACVVGAQRQDTGCVLTDGKLSANTASEGTATVDLGTQRSLSLIVLRGTFSSLTVASSTDGSSWTAVSTGLSGSFISIPGAVTARYLRVTEGLDERSQQRPLSLGELSAW